MPYETVSLLGLKVVTLLNQGSQSWGLHCVVYWNIRFAPCKKYNPSEDCNHYGITDVCTSDLLLPRAGSSVDTASGQQMVCTGTIVRSFVNICRCIHFKLPYNIQPYSQPRGVTGHTFASRWNIYLVALKLANVAIKYIIFIHFLSSLLLIDKSGECREACAGLIDDGWCPECPVCPVCPVSSPRKLIREQRQRIHPISRTVCHHQLTSRAPTGDPSHY